MCYTWICDYFLLELTLHTKMCNVRTYVTHFPNICYIRKYNMSKRTLHTKYDVWLLNLYYIRKCFFFLFVCVGVLFLFLGRLRPSKRLTSIKDVLGSNWQLPLGFNNRSCNISVMFSHLPKDRTLEMEDKWKMQSTAGPCPTICKSSRTPRHWKLPSTIAQPNHPVYENI